MKEIQHQKKEFILIAMGPYTIHECREGATSAIPPEVDYWLFDSYEEAKEYALSINPEWIDVYRQEDEQVLN